MPGELNPQAHLFSYFSSEQRVPLRHPLRRIKAFSDEALKSLCATLDAMYSEIGRPSIPPERLLKASLLIALYSVRSDRLFCEMLDYHILFRWFLEMNLEEPAFDASTFSKNRECLIEHAVVAQFFDAVVELARREGLLSDEDFTVDGTLIEAWASMKSFQRKGAPEGPPDDPGNPTVDFRGERRGNATHQARPGKEAKVAFSEHVLMENRNGLCVDVKVATTQMTEPQAACAMLARQAERGVAPASLGADKGYHVQAFVSASRARNIRPHIAQIASRKTRGLDRRTTRHAGYRLSQTRRKRVKEIFGWKKTIGGLRKTRFKGVARIQVLAYLVGAAYNLLRLARLVPAPG
jgi:transposase